MKALVTGGTGFVGRHLIDALLAEGQNQVCALVRDGSKLDACPIQGAISVIRGDLFRSQPFPEDTEVVFHLAAVTKAVTPAEFTRVNLEGTRALLERLEALPRLRKVVLLSSLAAAGPGRGSTALREDMPAEPISLYGRSKRAQEELFAGRCPVPFVIVRAPIVFGPGDMDMLDAFRIVAKGIVPLLGRKERRYSVIYVKDLVRAMIVAVDSPGRDDVFYVANPEAVEWRDFMEQVARLLGKRKARKVVVPEALGRVLAEFAELRIRVFGNKAIFNRDKFNEMKFPVWVCSAAKIEALLHYQPRFPLQAALEETIRWYRERDLL